MNKASQQIKTKIRGASALLILTHYDPDGDAVGSAAALAGIAKKINPRLKIDCISTEQYKTSIEYYLKKYKFKFPPAIDPAAYDLVIAVDTSTVSRLPLPINVDINIDHHLDNERYGSLNIIDAGASSVGVLIFRLAAALNIKIDKKMAEAIYLSVYTDTGQFSFANCNQEALSVASACLAAGADAHKVYSVLYEQESLADLCALGQALCSAQAYFDGRLIMGQIHKNSKLDNRILIDYLRREKNSEIAVVLVEKKKYIKLSFRSKTGLDVSKIAAVFSGGGHRRAAAGRIDGVSLARAKKIILKYFSENVF